MFCRLASVCNAERFFLVQIFILFAFWSEQERKKLKCKISKKTDLPSLLHYYLCATVNFSTVCDDNDDDDDDDDDDAVSLRFY